MNGGEELDTLSKGERTRRRLLEIAIERFGDRGYRATSVTEIARSAGLTQAAAYAYFQNKDALFRSAIHEDTSGLIEDALAAMGDVPVTQLAPSFLLCALAALDDHPLTRRVLSGAEPEALALIGEMPTLRQITTTVAARIREGQLRGEVRADIDPTQVADGMEALVIALLMSALHLDDTTADDRYLVGVVEVFDALLRPPADVTAPPGEIAPADLRSAGSQA